MKVLALLIASSLLLLSCSTDDESDSASDQVVVCRGVEQTRASLSDILESVVPLNEAALQDAVQEARADIDTLAGSVSESQGGGTPDSIEQLAKDIQAFQRLMATPQLSASDLRRQATVINDDLDAIAEEAGCPSGT